MAMTQLFHTIPTSCAILPPLIQICFVFVVCRRRVVEGSGVGGGGCVVYFDVHGEWVMVKKTSELWWCNDTLYLGCSYHLHSSHSFLSTWGLVMLKKKPKKNPTNKQKMNILLPTFPWYRNNIWELPISWYLAVCNGDIKKCWNRWSNVISKLNEPNLPHK